MTFSWDGQRILTVGNDRTARVWEAATGRELLVLRVGGVRSAAFSRDGQRIITMCQLHAWTDVGGRKVLGGLRWEARVWEALSGQEVLALRTQFSEDTRPICLDGAHIVTYCRGQTADGRWKHLGVNVLDAVTGTPLIAIKGGRPGQAAFSRDGTRMVNSGLSGGPVTVWETASGRECLTVRARCNFVSCVAISPDARLIAVGSSDGPAKVWDGATGKELATLVGHDGGITSLAFSPDGKRVVSGGPDGSVKLWDVSGGKELLNLRGAPDAACSVAISPDGLRIAVARQNSTPEVWEAATLEQVASWQSEESNASKRLAVLRLEEWEKQMPGALRLMHWYVLAPVPFSGVNGEVALDHEQIPQEALLHAPETLLGDVPFAEPALSIEEKERLNSVMVENRRVHWRCYSGDPVDFCRSVGEPAEWNVGYAVCYLHSDANQSGISLRVGSDDQAKIYVNGKEVYRCSKRRSYMPGEDVVPGVGLKAGLNVLVLKVVNEDLEWQGSVWLTDAKGWPPKGVSQTNWFSSTQR